MATKHPYIASPGPLIQVIEHLRNSFPATVSADTLKKLGYAPNNEGMVINILKFVGIVDEEGKKTSEGGKVFSQADAEFQAGMQRLVEMAYADLFSLHGDKAWELDRERLSSYFRTNDQSTALVGQRQASTFHALASLAGKGVAPAGRKGGGRSAAAPTGRRGASSATGRSSGAVPKPAVKNPPPANHGREVGLTVRVEINLPADGDQETYDRIFKSIRENLIDGR